MPRAPRPMPLTMSSFTASPPLSFLDLRRATASPSGASVGAWALAPGSALDGLAPGRVGMMAESGRSIGGGGAVVVVVVSSFGFLSFSGLAVVVVGAGAVGGRRGGRGLARGGRR